MRIIRNLGLALACAVGLMAGSVFADEPRLEHQLAYAFTDHGYGYDMVAAVHSERADAEVLAKLDERTGSQALAIHSGYLNKSSGAVQASTQYASLGVMHARHAA